jgi:hypothetical protein
MHTYLSSFNLKFGNFLTTHFEFLLCHNSKREYIKDEVSGIEANSNNKNIRDLYNDTDEFKKGYQPEVQELQCVWIPIAL